MKTNLTELTSFTVLKFSGAKTQEFLQGQLTCDMRELSPHGAHSFAAVCDHRGRMLANFWVVHWHTDFLLILPKSVSETVKNHLQKYAPFSKVIITSDNHFFIAEVTHYCGDKNAAILINLPSENRYLLIAEQNPFPKITINSDETQWQKNNIADQFVILCDKTSFLFTPQMINLEKSGALSFTKGCYVGQEIIARTEYLGKLKRHLHRITIQSDHPLHPGDELNNGMTGIVVSAVEISKNNYDLLAVIQDQPTQDR